MQIEIDIKIINKHKKKKKDYKTKLITKYKINTTLKFKPLRKFNKKK